MNLALWQLYSRRLKSFTVFFSPFPFNIILLTGNSHKEALQKSDCTGFILFRSVMSSPDVTVGEKKKSFLRWQKPSNQIQSDSVIVFPSRQLKGWFTGSAPQSIISNRFFMFRQPENWLWDLHQCFAGLEPRSACVRDWGRGYHDKQKPWKK